MDIIDQAQIREMNDTALSVEAARTAKSDAAATGYCLWCGPEVPLPDGKRWCDGDCRDDWQRDQNMKRR